MLIKLKKIISLFRKIPSALSEIPHLKKYALLSFLFSILFIIFNFPYENIISDKIKNIKSRSFSVTDFSGLTFSLLGESTLDRLQVDFRNGSDLKLKNIIINPSLNPFALMDRNYTADFEIKSMSYSNEKLSVLTSANGNTKISLSKKGLPKDGFLRIISGKTFVRLSNAEIPTPMGKFPLDLENIEIKNIDIKITFNNDKAIIEKIQVNGDDIGAQISGDIQLKTLLMNSGLKLIVSVDSSSKILSKYKDLLKSFIKDDKISFELNGSLARPKIKILK